MAIVRGITATEIDVDDPIGLRGRKGSWIYSGPLVGDHYRLPDNNDKRGPCCYDSYIFYLIEPVEHLNVRTQKADSAGCRSSSRGSGNVRERWNRSVRRRFPYRYLLLRPRLRSRALRGRGDEGTKKRETDLLEVASRLRSEEVRSSGPRWARSLVCQRIQLHGVLGT